MTTTVKKQSAPRLQSNNGYTLGEKITLHFDYYEYWKSKSHHSYKQIRGSQSGSKKKSTSKEAEVMAITEKAVQFVYFTHSEETTHPHYVWIPFSQLTREENKVTVNGSFCYNNQDKFVN